MHPTSMCYRYTLNDIHISLRVYTRCTYCIHVLYYNNITCTYMYMYIHDNTEMRERKKERKKERKTPEANEK